MMNKYMKIIVLFSVALIVISCSIKNTETPPTIIPTKPVAGLPPPLLSAPAPAPAETAQIKPAPAPVRKWSYSPSVTESSSYPMSKPQASVYIPFKQVLKRSEKLGKEYYTFVYLPSPATTTRLKKQYLLICQMWQDHFYPKKEVESIVTSSEGMVPVHWFVRDVYKGSDDCGKLILEYDYLRSNTLYSPKERPWTPALVSDYNGVKLVMKLGNLTNEEDIDRAFNVWKSYIAVPPTQDKVLDPVTWMYSVKAALGSLSYIVQFTH